ncbi:hypothetical protein ACFORO_03790 [Amycolatopsis halotolerans]|uniref:Uncharacterized protein n=1 Tax=Amycolatopsis halotolerans TaxID=330083 RepID=A0ABV7QBM2_9PSEU
MTDGPESGPAPQQMPPGEPAPMPGPAPQPVQWAGQPQQWAGQPNAQQYPSPYPPAQPWAAPAPANGVWLGVAALVLGLLGCVLPLLPIDLSGIRAYLALPFGLAGLACGLVGVIGRRTAKPLSAVGIAVSAIALILGMIMLSNQLVG